jgi:hypothetical protein
LKILPSATIGRLGAIIRKHKRRLAARGKDIETGNRGLSAIARADQRTKNLYEATSLVSRGLEGAWPRPREWNLGALPAKPGSRAAERQAARNFPICATAGTNRAGRGRHRVSCFAWKNICSGKKPNPDDMARLGRLAP